MNGYAKPTANKILKAAGITKKFNLRLYAAAQP